MIYPDLMELIQLIDIITAILPIFILLLIIVVVLAFGFIFFILYEVHRLPDNTPTKHLSRKEKGGLLNRNIVICVGDSITHGQISQNYVKMLKDKLGENYEFINAGLNSHLAWNVLERLDEIIKCKPTIVTILIGTNDVNAKLTKKNEKDYIKRMKLPQEPDHKWFCITIQKIIKRLKKETNAQIAVLTLPTIGEDLEVSFFDKTTQYSQSIIEIAQKLGVKSLPLHATMVNHLENDPSKPTFPYEKGHIYLLSSVIQHYFLRRSWDTIATNAGFKLHRDYLHMNTKGAMMIADLIEGYINSLN